MARYLITGVSRGIGRAVAAQLIDAGHEVLGLGRSEDAGADLNVAGTLVADLARPELLADVLSSAVAALLHLDGVVHCAGVVRPGLLGAGAEPVSAALTEQFSINVTAVAELTRLLLPSLRAAGGAVILINSGSGLTARTPLGGYGMSKFALRAYADVLRAEEPSLRVSTVYPGRTATEMQQTVRAAESGSYLPAGYLRPETVAGVIAGILALPADAVITDVTVRPRSQPGPSSPDALA